MTEPNNERLQAYTLLIKGLLGLRSQGSSESEFLIQTLPGLLAVVDSAEEPASEQVQPSASIPVSARSETPIEPSVQPARRPRLLVAGLTVVKPSSNNFSSPPLAASSEGEVDVTTLRLRPDFEAALRQIQGVRAASVVTNGTADPTEIHILAMTGRTPKQIVRDVQSLAIAQFDLEIDHRIVSVVQLEDADLGTVPVAPPTPEQNDGHHDNVAEATAETSNEVIELDARESAPVGLTVVPDSGSGRHAASFGGGTQATARVMAMPDVVADVAAESATSSAAASEEAGPRPSISAIMVRTSGDEAEATVTLVTNGELFEGQVVGPSNISHRPRLIAQATLRAVTELLGQQADIESVMIVPSAMKSIVLTVVSVLTPRIGEQSLTGSALVRGDEADAVARSVLDALNRRISG